MHAIGAVIIILIWSLSKTFPSQNSSKPPADKERYKQIKRSVRTVVFIMISILNFFTFLVFLTGPKPVPLLLVLFGLAPVLCVMKVLAWPFVRYVLIPHGFYRLAFFCGNQAMGDLKTSNQGRGLMAAVWALLQKGAASSKEIEFVRSRLRKSPILLANHLIALAFLCAAEEDFQQAGNILKCLDTLHPNLSSRFARKIINDWLIAEAASLGHWDRVEALALAEAAAGSARKRFLALVAKRMRPNGMSQTTFPQNSLPSEKQLRRAWFWTGKAAALQPLLERACQQKDVSVALPQLAWLDQPSMLQQALRMHAFLLRQPLDQCKASDVKTLAYLWDQTFSQPDLHRLITERGMALKVEDTKEVFESFQASVMKELSVLVRHAKVNIQEKLDTEAEYKSSVLTEMSANLRMDLLDEIDLQVDLLQQRTRAGRGLPLVEEWQEWANLRRRYQEAVQLCGIKLRRAAWPKFYADVSNYSVWLFNERKEKMLSNAIIQFLCQEATVLQDERAVKLQQKNAALGYI